MKNGKMVKIEPAPMVNPRHNRICLRGLSHLQRVYHADRLQYPLKRAGNRGEGKWQRITWDEAIDTIATKLNDIKTNYGSRAVLFAQLSGNYGIINGGYMGAFSMFANIFGATSADNAVDSAMSLGISQVLTNIPGRDAAYFQANEMLDVADNSRVVMAWGMDLAETEIQNWHFVADAIDNGAKLVAIDPRFSKTASKADIWLRPRPGSDCALALSMIEVVIEEKLYDTSFVLNSTVAPFLVRGDNSLFLRQKDVDGSNSIKYMVWDAASSKAVPFDATSSPALTGAFSANGIACKTAFQLLSDEAAKYKPEDVESVTTVPASDVRVVARLYATGGPSALLAGMGVDRYDNANLTGRAFATLAALTHNLGRPGASVGGFFGGSSVMNVAASAWQWTAPTGKYAPSLNLLQCYDAITTGQCNVSAAKDPLNKLLGVKTKDPQPVSYTLKAAVFADSNFVTSMPGQKRIIDDVMAPDKLEFIVVHDQFMTDTASYADIVLPATSWFENDDILTALHPNIMLQDKAIDNLYEAKSNWEFFQLLAQKMGFGDYFKGTGKDFRDFILGKLENTFGKEKIDPLRENGVTRLSAAPSIPFLDSKFLTDSGRVEFYAERVIVNSPYSYPALGIPITFGLNPLPHYEPPREVAPDNPLATKYPLTFFQKHALWRVHTQWFNVPWIRELDPYPHVDMTPGDASARSISEGDVVDVFNDRGSVTLKAHLTEALPDGVVNIDKGWQRSQFIAGGYQELTSDYINPITTNASYFDTRVEVKKHGGA